MSPRILFVDHTAQLGGAELFLLSLAESFPSGHVLLFEKGPLLERLMDKRISASVLPAPPALQDVRRDRGFLNVIRGLPGLLGHAVQVSRVARDYDVIFANSQKAMLIAGLAGLLARRPVVWYLHDLMTPEHFGAVHLRMAITAANGLVSRVIANSCASRDAFVACGGRADRTNVVYNGIEASPFQSVTDDEVTAIRRELRLPETGVVGIFSRLAEWKGQHVLLAALRGLPNVTAILVGGALFPEDEQYADRLCEDIKRWGLDDQVRFVGFRNDVSALMHVCDAVVHTSTSPEPFGRVIVEAMLAGRPVIATEQGGPAEIISGDTGLLVPASDTAALQNAIHRVIEDRQIASQIARNGRRRAQTVFSVKRMISGIRSEIARV